MSRTLISVSALLALSACVPIPDTSNALAVDDDEDGLTELDGDCNDADAAMGAWLWYEDADGDGHFGGEPIASCRQVADRTTTYSDCDDADPLAFVGAASEDVGACMRDADGDGFGDAAPAQDAVTAGTDCNDANAFMYPGAASEEPEVCTVDADGDGWGAQSNGGRDCEDQDAYVFPVSARF